VPTGDHRSARGRKSGAYQVNHFEEPDSSIEKAGRNRMGRQHIRDGVLHVKQRKTGAELAIPVLPELREILEATPSEHLTFIVSALGKPFHPGAFSNWFRAQCDAAGLPKGCSAHGLRKASCRRLAEYGCTVHQIAAISGHVTLEEVQRYTKAADQARLARSAMATVIKARPKVSRKLRGAASDCQTD
jgi:integrase